MSVRVVDPFGVAADPEMQTLAAAIDPVTVQRQFGRQLPRLAGDDGFVRVQAIRVARYKPGRRCLVEYDVQVERSGGMPQSVTLLGKVRRRRSGASAYVLLCRLWTAGFAADAEDRVTVPEPIGRVPDLRLWLQRKVAGRPATDFLSANGEAVGRRVAEAAHKLHRLGVPREPPRRHSMADELRILRECLPHVARREPRWAERIGHVLAACDRLGRATPASPSRWIHRDFYSDQIVVDGDTFCLIDFDEYCEGDPAVDIGNFSGALVEYGLRVFGDPKALGAVRLALEDRFLELSPGVAREAIRAYEMLTLVRQIYVSTKFADRRPFTEDLLSLCEERLRTSRRTYARA